MYKSSKKDDYKADIFLYSVLAEKKLQCGGYTTWKPSCCYVRSKFLEAASVVVVVPVVAVVVVVVATSY